MLLSAKYHPQMAATPQTVKCPPSYFVNRWHHPIVEQEPEDSPTNKDSRISPGHYNSDSSARNVSPQSCPSDDSGHPDQQSVRQTMGDDPSSSRNASISLLALPVLGASPNPHEADLPPSSYNRGNSPHSIYSPMSPQRPPVSGISPPGDPTPHSHRLQLSPCTRTNIAISKPSHDHNRSSSSPVDAEMFYDNPLRGLQMVLQRSGMMGTLPSEQPTVNGERPFQCLLCDHSTNTRADLNNHMISEHSEQVRCHFCDHMAENIIKLREHLQVEHNAEQGPEDECGVEDKTGVAIPKINSQGKMKVYRCKQCTFDTITKLEFWEHMRAHIKPERILACPKCPFVTEYKHHLEYHLRNHVGSKPFKCDKCAYACVNKSMLNSHKKSHSSVHQFHCADCGYATKYCHSLKLHLRKTKHRPDIVLNPDGSPNPLPIVDVYGSKRGPKRPKKTNETSSPLQPVLPSLPTMIPNPYGFLPSQTYPYNAVFAAFPGNSMIPFSSYSPLMREDPVQTNMGPVSNLFNAGLNTIQQSSLNNNREGGKDYPTRMMTNQDSLVVPTAEPAITAPLDLSAHVPVRPRSQEELEVETVTQTSTTVTKNRRKGKAFKLEQIAQRMQQYSSDEEAFNTSNNKIKIDSSLEHYKKNTDDGPRPPSPSKPPVSPLGSSPSSSIGTTSSSEITTGSDEGASNMYEALLQNGAGSSYECPHCNIIFSDPTMFNLHMGTHDIEEPFRCSFCGERTNDSLEFFVHFIQKSHPVQYG